MTSKEGPQLSYLNLRTIQSPYVIRIYHTAHIQYTILAQWFPNSSWKLNSAPTAFKAYITFEITLEETPLDTPAEFHLLEKRYLGICSAHIRTFLHIIQYTRPDLMYAFNCLYSHDSDP